MGPSPTKFITSEREAREELLKLEDQTSKVNSKLYELREHGRTIRLHRLQALDALETRRVTLTEILRRMEKELNDRDVYEYSDILAEVFGERKILAHRAVGLEALLCQVRVRFLCLHVRAFTLRIVLSLSWNKLSWILFDR